MNSFFQVFANYRMAMVLLLGFASGLPLGLTSGTLQAWMASEHVDLAVIGIFSLVGLPYTLKFLWAPLMDRFVPPFLGRRRGWMLVAQFGVALGLVGMSASNPVASPATMAALAFFVAFSSASQDIVVDAYRTEILATSERGAGSGVFILGYRMAMLTSGALALILSDHLPWRVVYLIMAAAMGVGVAAALAAPDPAGSVIHPRTVREAIVQPFVEFFNRPRAVEVLIFIVLFNLATVMTSAMTTPLMIQLDFTRTDIGAVNKGFGMIATIMGALFGGAMMTRLGMRRALWIFGLAQAFSNLVFAVLAHVGHSYPAMISAIAIENLCTGMGTAAFTAFLMSLCNQKFTATQYALLTSLMASTRVVLASSSGLLAKELGWSHYFLVSSSLAIPGLLMLTRFEQWGSVYFKTTDLKTARPGSL